MLRRVTIIPVSILAVIAACGDSGSSPPASSSSGGSPEAGPTTDAADDAAPRPDAATDAAAEADAPSGPSTVTVTTHAAKLARGLGTKESVTWAAYQDAAGTWKLLTPASAGTYTFKTEGPKWAVALVCASPDDAFADVSFYYRTTKTPSLAHAASSRCTTPLVLPSYLVTGSFTNMPVGTTRVGHGWANGSVSTGLGAGDTYTMFNVYAGTWDFAYATKDAYNGPFTRMLFKRGEVVNADKTIDVDMSAAGSFAPGSSSLTIRGLVGGETLTGGVFYSSDTAALGLVMSPDITPQIMPDNTFAYHTVPAAAKIAGDTYRGEYRSSVMGGATDRVIAFDFKAPVAIDRAFLAHLTGLTASVAGASPYVRLRVKADAVANAASYEVSNLTQATKFTRQYWVTSIDSAWLAPATAPDHTAPDLSAVAGWKNAWALPAAIEATAAVTATEVSAVLSDGTSSRSALASTKLTP